MKNYSNLGILGSVVPVPLCSVPLPNTFCKVVPVPLVSVPVPIGFSWVVPVPPCFGTGTTSKLLPRNANFASFVSNSPHTTSSFLNTSRINMEFIQNHSITLILVVWNLIPQNPR